MSNEFRIKNGFFSEGTSNITGSLAITVTASAAYFTGSFAGDGSKLVNLPVSVPTLTETIQAQIFSEGPTVTTGFKGYKTIGYNCTITSASIDSLYTGSITWGIRKNNATIATQSMSNNIYTLNTTLHNWTSSLQRGDLLQFYVTGSNGTSSGSNSVFSLTLYLQRT
jgi:hypothetical protein